MYNYQVFFAPVAQRIERLSSEQEAVGSIPAGRARFFGKRHYLSFSTYAHIYASKYGFYVDKCVYIVYKRQFFCTLKLTLRILVF